MRPSLRRTLAVLTCACAALCVFTLPLRAAVWRPVGPYGGTVTILAVSPSDPQTVLAGTTADGVFRSADGGATWQRSIDYNGTAWPIVFDPRRPGTVYASVGLSVLRSRNGGKTWTSFAGGPPSTNVIIALAVDPRGGAVYVADGGAILFRTVDGQHWDRVRQIPGAGTSALAFDPSGALYAATNTGVFRSKDRGASWRRLLDSPYLRAIAVAPSNPAVLYAGGSYGLHRSVDGGAHWQSIQAGLENQDVNAVAVHPTRPSVVYVALQTSAAATTGGVFRSLDGGAHWARLRAGLPPGNASVVALSPAAPSRVYAGFPLAGVFRSADAGLHWSEANAGLATFDVFRVAPDPERPGTVYAGPLEIGVAKTTDAGETWRIVNSRLRGPWAFSTVELDPRDSSIVYASIPGRLERSDDGGAHWRRADLPLRNTGFTGLIAFDPGSTLYAAGNHVFKSADRGETWEQVADLLPECSMTPLALAAGPSGVFVSALPGDSTRCPFLHLGVFRSTDGGANWTAVRDWVRRLAVDPADPQVAYALDDSFHLFKSIDGGATFTLLRADPFVGAYALTVDPASSRLYVGGPGYVFTSGDGGATWQRVGDPFEAAVFDLAPDPAVPGRLWAGTDRGIYVYDAD
jgi:photosystem II stability/assembly factor-like uncharacterized protein